MAKEIDVQYPADTTRASGYTIALGNVGRNVTQNIALTIVNVGDATLTLTNTTTDTAVNCAAGTIVQPGDLTLAGSQVDSTTVPITPSGFGAFSIKIHVNSDDGDEADYVINVTGNAIEVGNKPTNPLVRKTILRDFVF